MRPAKRTEPQALVAYEPADWADCPTTPSATQAGLGLIALGPHLWPVTWQPADWLVAVLADQIVQQGPLGSPVRGPVLFCCLKAFDLQRQYYPASGVAQADWRLTQPAEVETWAGSEQQVIYFVFCDPVRWAGLRAIALQGPLLTEVLRRQRPLESLTAYADLVG
ncbi:MAG: hypothetical protein KDF65_01395 [Anaerolineae bacterium]|nr:hypothetical protein [Anaerolineae bacterium]